MTRLIVAASVLALSASCLTEGNYPTKMGATFCKKFKECEPEAFDQEYSSVGECKDEARELAGDSDSGQTDCLNDIGCKFDRGAASDCRSSISSATCEEVTGGDVWLSSSCAEIYDCDGVPPEDIAACYN